MSPDARRRPINGVIAAAGTDLSHTIHGEAVLDSAQPKKSLSVSPRRKKHPSRPEKPRWATVLSVLAKNILLLAVLLWIGQWIWRWTDGGFPQFPPLDYEGRISEVESSLKKTAKALQLQLEVVDVKIGLEVDALKKGLKRVEERDVVLGTEMKQLGDRADQLSRTIHELKDGGVLSKAEFETLLDELKSGGDGDLDRVRAIAKEIVEEEIGKHAADGLGRVDYALASGGGKVVRHSEPFEFGTRKGKKWFGAAVSWDPVDDNAQKMLEASFGEPGQCFALKGSAGFVEIRLRTLIVPEAITLEHVSKSVAYDRSSAPKDCRVSGWLEGPGEEPSNRAKKMAVLTEFSYDLEKSNAQTFTVEGADENVINFIRLDFTSNYGNSDLTCIYRLRVHGSLPSLAVEEFTASLKAAPRG